MERYKNIPVNIGSCSQDIQLTGKDSHIALYHPAVQWGCCYPNIRKIRPQFMFSYYVNGKDYNLDSLVMHDCAHGYLGGALKECWVMEEDEDDNIIGFLGVIRWTKSKEELIAGKAVNELKLYNEISYEVEFEKPTWTEYQQASYAFKKDFLFSFPKHEREND